MPASFASLLRQTVEQELPLLRALPAEDSALPLSGGGSWSAREELGHLIDSASNNHIRFVLAATQAEFHGPAYAQNAWVDLHAYREMPWDRIVEFWSRYNLLLADLIGRIPDDKLTVNCFIGDAPPCSLAFVIEDYILHLKHHVDHLLRRPNITIYPSQKAAAAR